MATNLIGTVHPASTVRWTVDARSAATFPISNPDNAQSHDLRTGSTIVIHDLITYSTMFAGVSLLPFVSVKGILGLVCELKVGRRIYEFWVTKTSVGDNNKKKMERVFTHVAIPTDMCDPGEPIYTDRRIFPVDPDGFLRRTNAEWTRGLLRWEWDSNRNKILARDLILVRNQSRTVE